MCQVLPLLEQYKLAITLKLNLAEKFVVIVCLMLPGGKKKQIAF